MRSIMLLELPNPQPRIQRRVECGPRISRLQGEGGGERGWEGCLWHSQKKSGFFDNDIKDGCFLPGLTSRGIRGKRGTGA